MSAENILLNSPALNSLKRAQLVNLCKQNSLRANGKNVELIARLREHGRSGVILHVESEDARAEDDASQADADDDEVANQLQSSPVARNMLAPRPSEAWSVVDEPSDMDVDMPGRLPNISEFGGGESKVSSVSSSIKALAASLIPGASSARSKASSRHAVAQTTVAAELEVAQEAEASPPPESEPDVALNTSMDTIIREDVNLGASTIRLVGPSNPKKRGNTPPSPEYANPSPFKGKPLLGLPPSTSQLHLPLFPFASSSTVNLLSSYEAAPKSAGSHDNDKDAPLYPSLNPSMRSIATMSSDSFSMPGVFPEPPPRAYPAYAASSSSPSTSPVRAGIPTDMNPDFSFRAPIPKTSGSAPSDLARAAILAEMKKRLADDTAPSGDFSFVDVQGGGAKKRGREDDEDDSPSKRPVATSSIKSKFDKAHQKQFDNMPSIADHYAARRPSPRKSSLNTAGRANGYPRARTSMIGNRGGPRRSSAALRLSSAQSRTSTARTSMLDAPVEGGERPGKRARISTLNDDDTGIRHSLQSTAVPKPQIRISSVAPKLDNAPNVDITADTKKRVDAARARRKSRSSMGRQSLARAGVLGNAPPKPKGLTSRFGFLKSSAKLVKSVYTSVVGGGEQVGKADSKLKKPTASGAPSTKTASVSASTAGSKSSVPAPAIRRTSQAPISPPTVTRRTSRIDSSTAGPSKPSVSRLSPSAAASGSGATPRAIPRKVSSGNRPALPAWNSSVKQERSSMIGSHAGPVDSISSRLSQAPSVSAASTMRSEGSSAGQASSIGVKRASSTRSSAGFAAPTASSLARAAASAKAKAQSGIRPPGITSRQALALGSIPERGASAKPDPSTAASPTSPQTPRAAVPNKFGFVGSSPTKSVTSSRFMLSPQSTGAPGPSNIPQSTTSPRVLNRKEFTSFDSFSFSSPTRSQFANDTTVLDARENVPPVQGDDSVGETTAKSIKSPDTSVSSSGILSRSNTGASSATSGNSLRKRPRISRSRVIAKLGEKRAAEDAAAAAGLKSPQVLRAKGKTRSSAGEGLRAGGAIPTRRSFAAGASAGITGSPGLARREKAALESFQRGQRKSEAAARRRSSRAQVQASLTIVEHGESMDI